MKKKEYFISITGESGGYTTKYLTDSEYKLISDIFEECDSEYVGGHIEEIPDIDEIFTKLNISEYLYKEVSGKLYNMFPDMDPTLRAIIHYKIRDKFPSK